jgi:DNA-binding MarR family transcriptional regulator
MRPTTTRRAPRPYNAPHSTHAPRRNPIHEFEQCCWDLRGVLARFGPDEACCEGLTPRQCRVLRAVGQEPDVPLASIAVREGLTASGLTRRVDPLVAGGFLEREKGRPEDGRAVRLRLTARGRGALAAVEDRIYGSIETLWSALPAAERPRVLKALKTLVHAARVASPPPMEEDES